MTSTVRRTCFNADTCECPGCLLPAYRHESHCSRCAAVVWVVWYCLVCKHVREAEGPDNTDPRRVNIVFSWPDPPFKIPFRAMSICCVCAGDISDVSAWGVYFRESAGRPHIFVRYEVGNEVSE